MIEKIESIWVEDECTVEELFNMHYNRDTIFKTNNGHEIQPCDNLTTFSYNDELKTSLVKNIMRHKVTKDKYELKYKDKSVIVTGDHSCIIIDDDNCQIEVTAKEMKAGQYIVILNDENNYDIVKLEEAPKCIGQFESEYVYDIEVDAEEHNFFSNDILVHNSLYISYDNIICDILEKNTKKMNDDEVIEHCEQVDKILTSAFTAFNDKRALDVYNANENVISFEGEDLNRSYLTLAKKKYITHSVRDEYNNIVDEIHAKGVELVQSSTPAICRKELTKTVSMLMKDSNKDELVSYIKDFFNSFKIQNPDIIGKSMSVNNIKKWVDKSGNIIKGAPFGVKGAVLFNNLIDKHKLNNKYEKIASGDKCKIVYLTPESGVGNPIAIAFKESLPTEFNLDSRIDYDSQFEKTFSASVQRWFDAIGWGNIDYKYDALF